LFIMSRSRTSSESSDLGTDTSGGVSYDVDGKFTFSTVMRSGLAGLTKTTIDENGKFGYYSADMRPVPPGWYDLDKSKHMVPVGWYQMASNADKGK